MRRTSTNVFFFFKAAPSSWKPLRCKVWKCASAWSPPPRPPSPRPTCSCLPEGSAGCMAPCLRAACQVHSCDPSSLGCSHYRGLRAWPTRERVLLELSGDEGAKNCCGSPSPSGPTICASGLGIPAGLGLFLEPSEVFQIT